MRCKGRGARWGTSASVLDHPQRGYLVRSAPLRKLRFSVSAAVVEWVRQGGCKLDM